ncbi:hypothetical protein E2C01_081046 [Portunus trituberculatus]|uniref:Uncharacterized protein n=1 Tax=Portunus trituberculatus TaxID=210409 RepID=A0A5B7IUS2_PORTR|nr:hypothetical protein [Portunus trituberculatus]
MKFQWSVERGGDFNSAPQHCSLSHANKLLSPPLPAATHPSLLPRSHFQALLISSPVPPRPPFSGVLERT